jgi:hypothetical protein
MEVPGGPGVTGSVKAGTGISISADGTVSVDAGSNITKVVAGTNVTINPTSGVGVVTISASGGGGGGDGFPAGTSLIFAQASAPPGWTKATDVNDAALRLVSGTGGGSGGNTAFSSAFASYTPAGSVSVSLSGLSLSGGATNQVDQTPKGTVSVSLSGLALSGATTNTVNQTPAGTVSLSGATIGAMTLTTTQIASHTHTYQQRPSGGSQGGGAGGVNNQTSAQTEATGGNGQHTHSISGNTGTFSGQQLSHSHTVSGSVGGSASGAFTGQSMSHSHTVTGSVSGSASGSFTGTATAQFSVRYKDVIHCTKS